MAQYSKTTSQNLCMSIRGRIWGAQIVEATRTGGDSTIVAAEEAAIRICRSVQGIFHAIRELSGWKRQGDTSSICCRKRKGPECCVVNVGKAVLQQKQQVFAEGCCVSPVSLRASEVFADVQTKPDTCK